MLELQNVTKSFGKDVMAVAGLSLALQPGVVGLIGHNGAGKTTLMQMIATLTKPSSVRDPARIRRLLDLVNLQAQAKRMASTFSGGMLRRLGIAQALLNDPDILVVDEPTAGLDPEERLRFRTLLAELGFDKLVIISTHIVSDVETIAGQLAIMRGGRLVACDTPDAILARARGQVWSASVDAAGYDALRATTHVLQALRQGERIALRIAHPTLPCPGVRLAEPSLEEALMAQRYAVNEAVREHA